MNESSLIHQFESKLGDYKNDLVIFATGSWGMMDLKADSDLDLVVVLKIDLASKKRKIHELLRAVNSSQFKFDKNLSPQNINSIFTVTEWTERIHDPVISNRLISLSMNLKARFLFGNQDILKSLRKDISLEAKQLTLKELTIQSFRQIWASGKSEEDISKVYLSHFFLKKTLIDSPELLDADNDKLKSIYHELKIEISKLKEKSKLSLMKILIRDLLK